MARKTEDRIRHRLKYCYCPAPLEKQKNQKTRPLGNWLDEKKRRLQVSVKRKGGRLGEERRARSGARQVKYSAPLGFCFNDDISFFNLRTPG
jgi:hypothetical protein